MAMSHNLSDRDFEVAYGRSRSDTKMFNSTMSDDMKVKATKQTLTAKTAPVTKRPARVERDLRNAFRF